MLVSVIIPTFNRAIDLRRAIDSVLKQTYFDWELIVVDNHSTDSTDELIRSYQNSKIRIFKVHNNGIIAKSRNLGIQQSKGELIAFLDSDDWWTKDKLSVSVNDMMSENADLIYHSLFKAVKEKQIFYPTIKVRELNGNIFENLLIGGNCIPNSSVVVKKSILEKIGNLCENPEIRTWEDYDAWLRISKISNKFFKNKKTLGYVWLGGGNELMGSNDISALEQKFANIIEFEKRYQTDIEKCIKVKSKPWSNNFQKGRLLFQLKKMDESWRTLKKIELGKIPFIFILKIAYMALIIKYGTIFPNEKH
jgi:glycosyltransferase involved in cell wall biosynthesis